MASVEVESAPTTLPENVTAEVKTTVDAPKEAEPVVAPPPPPALVTEEPKEETAVEAPLPAAEPPTDAAVETETKEVVEEPKVEEAPATETVAGEAPVTEEPKELAEKDEKDGEVGGEVAAATTGAPVEKTEE